ncbi:hypothetical protein UlMin_018687 [Ulmus minor]
MKWGRKKLSSSSYASPSLPSSRPFLVSHVFPTSWLSKFKQKSGNSEPKPRKVNPKGKWNSPSMNSPKWANGVGPTGSLYGLEDDDEAFWRLSFGQEDAEGRKSVAGLQSVWSDSDDELQFLPLICSSCRRKEAQNLNEMHKCQRDLRRERNKMMRNAGKRTEKDKNGALDMAAARRIQREAKEKLEQEASNGVTRKCHYVSPKDERSSCLKTNPSFEWRNLKELKMEELKAKSEKQRKSPYISREHQRKSEKQSKKVKIFSPRTILRVETCKVKALEDMKRAKTKMNKKKNETKKERAEQSKTELDSFAVVKCSYNPQKDFKDSMVEMIMEKKISKPEELEELLACYLTLNSDEYHDLIIKVFRQVWLELGHECFGREMQNEPSFSD